jgi:hypothetical protein
MLIIGLFDKLEFDNGGYPYEKDDGFTHYNSRDAVFSGMQHILLR